MQSGWYNIEHLPEKTGRIELTSERTDREEEIKELKKSIAEEKDMRATENTNYVAALDEMTKAIAALEKAVDTMAKGTEGSSGLASRSKSIFDTLYLYFRRPVLGCIDADLCK